MVHLKHTINSQDVNKFMGKHSPWPADGAKAVISQHKLLKRWYYVVAHNIFQE
jgi:hypothetical protein